ncbi:hypothetical protein [Maribacter sp. ACAM166]|uniref:hypothetical protein n=1 Tax=Maribacter sp. ACAM166 TaxID=2508996 RepID=UPI0010FEBDE3|nr:hypothetical protein [Maribacter sp. ACAM166]TLP70653.1 hypothetical protein ES765_20525 [Maribacter sp. ACAM166]
MRHLIFIILLIVTVVASCKNTEKQEEIINANEAIQEHVDGVLSTQWMNNMQLNKGAKWGANIETSEGVKKMQALLKSQRTKSIEDYHQLANKLNDSKNNVVKECTMKGASHDNLHVWLLPLIKKIELLSETKLVEDASKIKQSIEENINTYSDYFE